MSYDGVAILQYTLDHQVHDVHFDVDWFDVPFTKPIFHSTPKTLLQILSTRRLQRLTGLPSQSQTLRTFWIPHVYRFFLKLIFRLASCAVR